MKINHKKGFSIKLKPFQIQLNRQQKIPQDLVQKTTRVTRRDNTTGHE